jgi:hypothetical protein
VTVNVSKQIVRVQASDAGELLSPVTKAWTARSSSSVSRNPPWRTPTVDGGRTCLDRGQ